MKVSQMLVAALTLFALSLSVTKIARADWDISGSALISTGSEYLYSSGSATYAEAFSAQGGGVNKEIFILHTVEPAVKVSVSLSI